MARRVAVAVLFDGVVVPAAIVWHTLSVGWVAGVAFGRGEGLRWALLSIGWVAAVGWTFFVVPALDAAASGLGKTWQGVALVGRPTGFVDDPSAVRPPIGFGAAFVRNLVDLGTGVGWALGLRGDGQTLGDRLVGSRPVLPT